MELKICVKCKYYVENVAPKYGLCGAQKKSEGLATELVVGEGKVDPTDLYYFCTTQRSSESNTCGAAGKWFEPKPGEEQPL